LVGLQGGIIHAYDLEWIILDFRDNGTRVYIASSSDGLPVEIANRIISEYYGKDREYANESATTYRKQIEHFLGEVRGIQEGNLVLVEAAVANSPLNGSPSIRIGGSRCRYIGDALDHFEQFFGSPFAHVEQIESVKVIFCKKRVSLHFEPEGGTLEGFVVRYSDHRLNALQRIEFEKLMRDEHGIEVFSTAKAIQGIS
jgi:hypothetical protein